ncbi:MAG: GNAT family N-acetyltransferase [Paracoccaceae bacterium]
MSATADMQVIETDRLVLRPPKASDKDAYIDFFLSDRATYVGQASNRYQAWKTFAMEAGHWFLHGWGPWVVTRKGSDQAIGSVGPWHPEDFPERELGWLAFAGTEGQGIAFEAAIAARAHDYRTHGAQTLVSYIDPENERSIRLAERLGAVRDDAAARPDPIDLVYRHPSPEVRK